MTRRAKSSKNHRNLKSNRGNTPQKTRAVPAYQSRLDSEKQMKLFVRESGYTYKDVDGDGNCLFRALSLHIYHTADAHLYVRSRLAEHIKTHKFYEAFIEKNVDRDLDSFVDRINRSSTHGGHIELVACARSYGVNIEVYQLNLPTVVIEGGWVDEPDECGECAKVTDPKELPIIRLVYHSWGHYSCAIESSKKKNKHFPLKIPPDYDKSQDLSLNGSRKQSPPAGLEPSDNTPKEPLKREGRELWRLITNVYKIRSDETADKDRADRDSLPAYDPQPACDSQRNVSLSKERWEIRKLITKAIRINKLRDVPVKDLDTAVEKVELPKERREIRKLLSNVMKLKELQCADSTNALMRELRTALCQNQFPVNSEDSSSSSSTAGNRRPSALLLNCKTVNSTNSREMEAVIEKVSSIDLSVGSE